MSVPVYTSRRRSPILVKLLVAGVAGLGLTALVLVVGPSARVGLTLIAVLSLVGVVAWLGGRPQPAATELDRLGGDEFAVLIEDVAGGDEVAAVADRIVAAIARPVVVGGHELSVRVSLGAATSPEGGESVDELLTNADAAMYVAKAAGKGRSAIYEPGMRIGTVERQAHAPEGLVLKVRREIA